MSPGEEEDDDDEVEPDQPRLVKNCFLTFQFPVYLWIAFQIDLKTYRACGNFEIKFQVNYWTYHCKTKHPKNFIFLYATQYFHSRASEALSQINLKMAFHFYISYKPFGHTYQCKYFLLEWDFLCTCWNVKIPVTPWIFTDSSNKILLVCSAF